MSCLSSFIVFLQAAKRFVRLSQNDLCDFHVY
jgi:hypothetical protein